YFYLSLSNRKLNLIHSLYKVVPTEAFGFYSTCFKLLNDVPLNLVIRKKSRILKSIAPVEGYAYTEAQLAAIEKFNVLYP
ncbi:MAG: hypothetical protein IIY02_04720, partial [Firmicutes bacterium]|nr:hypothetical protein [Bacillota bacterium]